MSEGKLQATVLCSKGLTGNEGVNTPFALLVDHLAWRALYAESTPPQGWGWACRQTAWTGGLLPCPSSQITQLDTHGSNTSWMLFKIAFPPMIIVSCVVSSKRQPPGSHWNIKKKISFRS